MRTTVFTPLTAVDKLTIEIGDERYELPVYEAEDLALGIERAAGRVAELREEQERAALMRKAEGMGEAAIRLTELSFVFPHFQIVEGAGGDIEWKSPYHSFTKESSTGYRVVYPGGTAKVIAETEIYELAKTLVICDEIADSASELLADLASLGPFVGFEYHGDNDYRFKQYALKWCKEFSEWFWFDLGAGGVETGDLEQFAEELLGDFWCLFEFLQMTRFSQRIMQAAIEADVDYSVREDGLYLGKEQFGIRWDFEFESWIYASSGDPLSVRDVVDLIEGIGKERGNHAERD
jgi:hypothetical protein